MTAASIAVENMSLRYGTREAGVLALRDITLSIANGEFVAVVGPSGCGKSTLLKAIAGLWPVSSGSVHVDGSKVTKPLKTVGMAFQNSTLLPWRNTLYNVLLPLQIVEPYRSQFRLRRQEYEAKALDLLARVGLKNFAEKSIWQLSGGMQQRAQLCRALIHEPSLLLLDEPFAALDAFTREELWQVMQALWIEKHPTVILVTHDLREAAFLADRVYLMSARPGTITAERRVTVERPRQLAITFGHEFADTVSALRAHIDEARSSPGATTGEGR
jgi:NitT/TauT family transport system ATP-binding protein